MTENNLKRRRGRMVSVNTIGQKIKFFKIIRLTLVNDTTSHVSADKDQL